MKHGDISRLARKVEITPAHMGQILRRLRRPSPEVARKLAEETRTTLESWLFPDEYPNSYLSADDNGEKKT